MKHRQLPHKASVGLIVLALFGSACGLNIHDPTEGTVQVRIPNDTSATVSMAFCEDDAYKVPHGARSLAPGDSFLQNVQPQSRTAFLVRDQGATPAGPPRCVVLVTGASVQSQYALSTLPKCAT